MLSVIEILPLQLHICIGRNNSDVVDLLLVAVKPEYQNKGVNALLFEYLIPVFNKCGFKEAESNPELASNANVQLQWQYFNHRQHRRRRAFNEGNDMPMPTILRSASAITHTPSSLISPRYIPI